MASIYPNRKNGKIISFKFKAFLGRDEDGKQITKCTTWKPVKDMSESKLLTQANKEAIIWEKQVIDEYEKMGELAEPTDVTFEQFINDIWLPGQKSDNEHRESTIAFYSYILKIALTRLGNKQIKKITEKHISDYLSYLRNIYKTSRGRALSPRTIRHHYRVLKLIFGYACKYEYLYKNPMEKIEPPKFKTHKVDALSVGEVHRYIEAVETLPLTNRLMYMFILTTGMRRGELFGMQWQDIDLENKVVHIRRNVTYTAIAGITVGAPKTDTGIRDIPITDKLYNLIIEYKSEESKNNELTKDMFLFHAAASPYRPHEPTYLTKHMKRFMKKNDLPDMSPHDIRHTCATLLIRSGADIKSVQDILGHSDASTTLNFYVRSDIDTMRKSIDNVFNI